MADNFSDADLDAMTRTMLTEAGSGDLTGQLAVGSTVANRMAAGGFGNTPSAVVMAPHQFEVWANGRAQAVDPNSPAYGIARQMASDILSGAAPDPTGGATHFFSPAGQDKLGRSIPSWAGGGVMIGGNVYNAPNGPVMRQQRQAQPQDQQQPGANPDDVFGELMAHAQGAASTSQASVSAQGQTMPAPAASGIPATGAPAASVDDVFSELTAHAAHNAKPAALAASPAATAPSVATQVAAGPQSPPTNADNSAEAVGRGILEGVPIAGPAILGGVNRLAAAVRAYREDVPYSKALQEVQGVSDDLASDHPYATLGGNALGAAVAMAPAIAAAPAVFGVGGGLSVGGLAAGAGSGAAIGGLDAGVRSGGDAYAAVKGAGVGGVFGLAGPIVAQGAGYLGNKLFNVAADVAAKGRDGISASARNALMDAINRDGQQSIDAQLQQLGPNGMLADTGSGVQGLAQGVAVRPEGAPLIQAIKDRAAGANARIRDAVAGLGPAEDPQTVTNNILDLRKQVDDANYGAVRAGAPPVDVSNVVSLIDRQLGAGGAEGAQKTALQNLRDQLVTSPAQPATAGQPSTLLDSSGNRIVSEGTPAQPEQLQTAFNNLHNLKGEIDGLIDGSTPGLGVERGSVNRQQGSLMAVRGALNDALESQVPGYLEANAASSALAKRAEAVEAGVNTLGSGKTTPTPERFVDEFNQLSPGEQIAQAKGLLGEVNRLIGTKANDLGAMRTALQGEEGWNTAKMGRVLGDQPVNALMQAVGQEGTYGNTFNKVVGNAQTAFRNQSAAALDQNSPFGLDLDFSKVSTPGMVLGTLKGALYNPLVRALATTDTATRDAELAHILALQGPQRDAFMNKLYQAAGYRAGVPAWAGTLGRAAGAFTAGAQEPYRLAR